MFTHQEKNGSTKLCPTCVVVNTDIHIINKARSLLEALECKFILHEFQPKKKEYKLQWRITTRNMSYIKKFLTAVLPYLVGEKKAKGEILLSYVTQRLQKMERFPSKGSTPYDEVDWAHFTAIRSSTTTREGASAQDIV